MTTVSKVFVLAGLVNIGGVLLFSAGFTNDYLSELYPAVVSWFGLIAIMLWGAAYIAVAKSYARVRALVAVFMVEKLVYFATWVCWLLYPRPSLGEIFETSVLTGAFYASYGLIDLAFGVFFGWVAFARAAPASPAEVTT